MQIASDEEDESLYHNLWRAALAGHAAQRHFAGRSIRFAGSVQDYRQAFDVADYVCGSPEESQALVKWLAVRAKLLVASPHNAAAVEAVASDLLKHKRLPAKAVRELYRRCGRPPAG